MSEEIVMEAPAAGPAPLATAITGFLRDFGIYLDTAGAIWQYQGINGMSQLGQAIASQSLAAALAVTPTTVLTPAGQWILTTSTGVSTLVTSTGSTTAGITGNAYRLLP
jgi:hypothetical protein